METRSGPGLGEIKPWTEQDRAGIGDRNRVGSKKDRARTGTGSEWDQGGLGMEENGGRWGRDGIRMESRWDLAGTRVGTDGIGMKSGRDRAGIRKRAEWDRNGVETEIGWDKVGTDGIGMRSGWKREGIKLGPGRDGMGSRWYRAGNGVSALWVAANTIRLSGDMLRRW
ncbi:hypothetical protein CBR_g39 [Chara braunii]|uniref:Uncharacterized protein n=1 Tax=Chara braunii TaxID=69332 RepID=A0A388JLF2_CHABU|nr:hypothetical protein CBR_g39 [Chara braunii]|eukprot:GBG58640.1 hypothetical protein CBR_g39 [Chara braunii]